MANIQSSDRAGESPAGEGVTAKKAAPVIEEPRSGLKYKAFGIVEPERQKESPRAVSSPARPLKTPEAKAGLVSAAPERPAQRPASGPSLLRPLNLREAKEGLTLVAPARPAQRPAPGPSLLKPLNLREAKEGLTLTAPSRPLNAGKAKEVTARAAKASPHEKPALRPSPAKPLNRPEAKGSSAPLAKASPHERPAVSPALAKAEEKAGRAGQEVIKERPRKPEAQTEKAAAPREADPAPHAAKVAEGPKCDLHAARKVPLITPISYFLLSMVLLAGWFYSGEEILTAKEGTGYTIGIVGGAMMLLLILYPLRKTSRFMRRLGAIKQWFRLHMILGLAGPALILFHANFSMGSLNSSVALTAMLLVAGSGLVGRYIYAGIHYGLYGREMNLVDLKKDFEDNSAGMVYVLDYAPTIQKRLQGFDTNALKQRYSFAGSLIGLVMIFFSAMWLRLILFFALGRTLRVAARRSKWSHAEKKAHGHATRFYISSHISAAMAISRFKVYERLFSLWHILHMPLFFMLVLTAIVHVVAVHMF